MAIVMQMSRRESRSSAGPDHVTLQALITWLSCKPSIFPSIKVFSNESVLLIMWPKYWKFSFSISPLSEDSGLISFRIYLFDLLQSKGLSRVFSNTTVQKHQFFSAQLVCSPTLTSICDYRKNHGFDNMDLCWQSNISGF